MEYSIWLTSYLRCKGMMLLGPLTYTRAISQAEQLSEFYDVCKTVHIGRGERWLRIEQPPASFLHTMEEYVRDAPLASTNQRDQAVPAIECRRKPEDEEASTSPPPVSTSEPEPEPEPVKEVSPIVEPTDLLGMNESTTDTSEIDQKNALALAIVQPDNAPKAAAPASTENVATSWELALVTTSSWNGSVVTSSKSAGGLNLLTLDSLYNEAHRRGQQKASFSPWEATPASGPMMQQPMHNQFYASNTIAALRPTTYRWRSCSSSSSSKLSCSSSSSSKLSCPSSSSSKLSCSSSSRRG